MTDPAEEGAGAVPENEHASRAPGLMERGALTRVFLSAMAVVAAAGLAYAAWQLAFLLLMVFASVVLAVALRGMAGSLSRTSGLPPGPALGAVAAGVVLGIAAFALFVEPRLAEGIAELRAVLPERLAQAEAWLAGRSWGAMVLAAAERSEPPDWNVLGAITGTLSSVLGLLANLLVVVSLAGFLAAGPGGYREGALLLLPPARRDRTRAFLDACGAGIRGWLKGQLLAMAIVAALMAAGLAALGVEPFLVLALLAGLANVVPYLGPYIGGAPAVLMALSQGPGTALAVVALIVAVQNLEGNLITPRIQSGTIAISPGLIIVGLVGFGVLFGLLGVLLATPILFVLVTAVRWFYVEDVLGEPPRAGR
jgi:predicted PurR-regulated permease PerM